jgi:hypothetical protein
MSLCRWPCSEEAEGIKLRLQAQSPRHDYRLNQDAPRDFRRAPLALGENDRHFSDTATRAPWAR